MLMCQQILQVYNSSSGPIIVSKTGFPEESEGMLSGLSLDVSINSINLSRLSFSFATVPASRLHGCIVCYVHQFSIPGFEPSAQ